jgi:hypothetical protein
MAQPLLSRTAQQTKTHLTIRTIQPPPHRLNPAKTTGEQATRLSMCVAQHADSQREARRPLKPRHSSKKLCVRWRSQQVPRYFFAFTHSFSQEISTRLQHRVQNSRRPLSAALHEIFCSDRAQGDLIHMPRHRMTRHAARQRCAALGERAISLEWYSGASAEVRPMVLQIPLRDLLARRPVEALGVFQKFADRPRPEGAADDVWVQPDAHDPATHPA